MKPYSITRRLILTVLLVELISALCVTAVALVYERHVHFRSFDILLRGRADSTLGAVQDAEDPADNVMLDGSEIGFPSEDVYEVRDIGGRLVGRSANWSGAAHLSFHEQDRDEENGHHPSSTMKDAFTNDRIAGKVYRLIRIGGLRIVDPGDKGGGVRRYVVVYYGAPVRRVWMAIFRAAGFYAASSILVLALTGVLMLWLLNRGMRPVRMLAAAAAGVSVSSWEFSPPESARMTQELAPLVTAIETVLLGLERSFNQQRRFVGDAAHELKTGVALIKSSLQLLAMKPRTEEEYRSGLERCLLDCNRIETIVAQMLTLARIEDGYAAHAMTPSTEVADAVAQVVLRLESMAEFKGVAIRTHQSEASRNERAFVAIDPEQFELLCSNILLNAIQHSPRGAVIRIEMRRGDGFGEVEFRDEGDGIDPAQLPFVFERFSRGDPSRSRNTGGTGLGLAICKAIVDRFGGTILMDSEPGKGTIAQVRFPSVNIQEQEPAKGSGLAT